MFLQDEFLIDNVRFIDFNLFIYLKVFEIIAYIIARIKVKNDLFLKKHQH